MFDEWRTSVEIRLKRSPNYWNKGPENKPYLDGIAYRFIKEGNTLKIQLRTGEVDIINPPVDTNLIDELKTFPRAKFQSKPGGFWENMAFQTQKGQLKDKKVRQAIAYAIDRKQITEVVLRGQTVPLQSTLLDSNIEFIPSWEAYKYDEAKVTSLLKSAGYAKNGKYWTKGGKELEVTLKTTSGNPLRAKVAQLLQQRFKDNGIKMNLIAEEPAVFFGTTTPTGNYDLGIWAWSSGPEPNQTGLFACDQVPSKKNQFQGNNNYRYCSEEVTALLKKADLTVAQADRTKMLKEVQTLMAEDMPVLPLYQRPETVAFSMRLHGVENNTLSSARHLWNTYDWWLEQ
jgi:peptide/nickel transport system substrate-binding protein